MPIRGHKYGVANEADRTWRGVTYASKAEMCRAQELAILLLAGEVLEVRRQPVYMLGDIKYVADFKVRDKSGEVYTEEVKGHATPMWKLNKRLWGMHGPHKLKVLTGKPGNWGVEWVDGATS